MNEVINKEELKVLGFQLKETVKGSKGKASRFAYENVEVTIFEKEEDYPEIKIHGIEFPGAYTVKDLKDLLFSKYGEKEYSKRFAKGETKIVSISYSEEAVKGMLMRAFDEGFQSADPSVSGEDYQITSADWYQKYHANK